ncbi:rifin [Plasmodium reichenowi]|uniref:Rifin n=1 Tax=Plasmodium reichenowi TaxID=5854 RepID=A0A151L241_PLARE|nr:rifin [Plasmodium reichenowi]KYN93023.1 rifin [Plasmodium reichenowi]
MKVHYINILLFALPLSILLLSSQVYNHRNYYITTLHTQTNRSLCECELYAPSNYDNDPQMKKVMQQFDDRISQRFKEYNERMKTTRQKCKDKCDKEVQKIILKDKLEKELMDKFATLQTDIKSDSIPTCICEKSLADKTEKFCLNCGKHMGAIAPWWGLICGTGYAGWSHYVAGITAKLATDAGIEEGLKVGLAKVTVIAKDLSKGLGEIPTIKVLQEIIAGKFTDRVTLHGIFKCISSNMNGQLQADKYELFSATVDTMAKQTLTRFNNWYPTPAAAVENAVANAKAGVLAEGASKTSSLITPITASVVTIVVIILIMVIIYLILRHRRKKKMKKKLQYIKILEE